MRDRGQFATTRVDQFLIKNWFVENHVPITVVWVLMVRVWVLDIISIRVQLLILAMITANLTFGNRFRLMVAVLVMLIMGICVGWEMRIEMVVIIPMGLMMMLRVGLVL